ncbi:uncharacterized protein Z519_01302 [Cladophialophora bantiana CBS 173.52]|uniref:Uncharacterized protein n=1 Tax=Cladophialophora bantiana (strain ATCC 10958 / CBS 173.52 / CDC B-1940 / NIH 8579) TaxID=1442370 RepID=A0A0D2HWH4_CLAB1|nr:uncharacterized protein Z519_01302 [Cladophialophora bantiana CBS 173.52]KIW97718.1 hypothetical protein Z519_01302 [Cladophialophora bantiana CBS 173.52]
MARAAGKRANKSAGSSTTHTKPPASPASAPPTPFQYAPASLRPFLSTLPTDHIYLVHLDHTPPSLKKRVFAVPVLLNLLITIGLCVRLYYAVPTYLEQIITIFGYDTAYKIDTATAGVGELINAVTSRTVLLMIDYAIFGLIGSWPKEFVFGSRLLRSVGPWEWRRTIGFRDTEIIVRRGRKWDTPLLVGDNPDKAKTWNLDEELTIKVKVDPAMRTTSLAKTGYLLLDKDWDLDFKAMLDAHRLVEKGAIKLKDLENLALVYYEKHWLVWKVHEAPEIIAHEQQQDSTVERFRRILTELGAEAVFFRWIEIVQFETSQPGGFTEGRQAEAIRELRTRLEKKGVDYAKFWEDIGGQAGLPGFDVRNQ